MPKTHTLALELPMQARALPISSVNGEKRTIDVIFSTGAKVRRTRWENWDRIPYDESLAISKEAINLERLQTGGPVLDSHDTWTTRSQIAVVDKAWVEGNQAMARVRFPSAGIDADSDRMWGLVSEGIIRNISVGYSQDEIRIIEANSEEGIEQRIVERWTPHEISFVTVPADPGAQTRGKDARADGPVRSFPAVIISQTNKETDMPDPVRNTPEEPAANPPTPVGSPDAVLAQERQRAAEIMHLARQHGMPEEFATNHVAQGTRLETVRAAILDELAERAKETAVPTVKVTRDAGDTLRSAVENAVEHRANPAIKLTDPARDWRGMSLLEMGRSFIEETTGKRLRGMDKMQLAGIILGLDTRAGMMSTGDFPQLLANVSNKVLRDGYASAVQTWRPFCRQSTLPDFKERIIVQMEGMPELKQVREGQEYSYASLGESGEKYSLATYGRIIAITRQTIINDDLGAFNRIPSLFGRAAAELESDLVWGILLSNPKMSDGKELFHADHSNILNAGVPSEATLEAADIAMGMQLDAANKPLNLRPKFLACSRKHKVAAQKLLTAVQAVKTGDVNVFQNSLELIVEDRLQGQGTALSPWFEICDPGQWDTIEYAYLEGQQGLYTEQRIGFEVDGIETKCRLDFGAKALDFKGFQKNPGT